MRNTQDTKVGKDDDSDEANNKHTELKETKEKLFKLQDQWINKGENPKVISICDPEGEGTGRTRRITVDNKSVRVRGELLNKVSKIDWVDPMFMSNKWCSITPL